MPANASPRKPTRDTYQKVFGPGKRRVRGMWRRNGRFFASVTIPDNAGRKSSRIVPLNGAILDEAPSSRLQNSESLFD